MGVESIQICSNVKWVFRCHADIYKDYKSCLFELRQRGHLPLVFADHSYLQGDTEIECFENVKPRIGLLK